MFFVLLLVAVGLYGLLALWSPVFLLNYALLTGPIPLTPGSDEISSTPMGHMSLAAVRLFGLWVAVCLVLVPRLSKTLKYLSRYKLHLLFLAFCLTSILWAPSLSFGLRMIAKLSAPLLFVMLVMTAVSSTRQLLQTERIILASGIVMVVLALMARLFGLSSDPRLTLPHTSPATFSAHIAAVSMLAMAGFAVADKTLSRGLMIIGFSIVVMAAFTRITIAAIFIGFSVILFLGRRGIGRIILPVFSIVSFPALFLLSPKFRSRMFIGGEEMSFDTVIANPEDAVGRIHGSGRFDAWEMVLNRFFEPHPLLGSGIGATQDFFYERSAGGLGVIHSEYVRMLSEIGVVGLTLFILVILGYLWRLFRILRFRDDSQTRKYALAGVGGLTTYVIFIATDNGFDYVTQFAIFVFSLVAMAEKANELSEKHGGAR
jgi:O-antigen ligase